MSPGRADGISVAVALCTHNGERFIDDQLASILAQTRLPDHIVISDDASTDGTLARVAAAVDGHAASAESPVRFTVLRNDAALGVAANFEQAIAASTSDLVALSDQDDLWEPTRLERAVGMFAQRETLLLVHGNARLIDAEGAFLPATLFEALGIGPAVVRDINAGSELAWLLRRNLVTGATTVIRRRLFEAARPVPSPWLHDEWFGIVAAAIGETDVIAEPLVRYRQHGTNEIGASKLGVAGKFGRMREPGAERNRRLLARAEALVARFTELGDLVTPAQQAAVTQKLAHEKLRSSLPANRLRRAPLVARELATGRYRRFGRGVLDAARDLIQPLDAAR